MSFILKSCLSFVLTFISTSLIYSCDVDQIEFPQDNQLYARDSITNLAEISFLSVNDLLCADSLGLFVYRDSLLIDSLFVHFTNDSAIYCYSILAELASYDFDLYSYENSTMTLVKSANNIVGGDVYVFDGQSNAEARGWVWWDTIPSFEESPFIRVFASGTQYATVANDLNWYQGIAMADRNTSGNLGGLAAKVAKEIVDNQQIPVAIFNGAHGGTPMSFHVPNAVNHEDLNTNYGRLLYRLRKTGLENNVKGIVWYQGESDTRSDVLIHVSKENYKDMFLEMYDGWKMDFPSFEQVYLIQIRAGCNRPALNVLEIQEAHRLLSLEKNDIQIISTKGIPMGLDNCHYYYINGCQSIGERIYNLIDRDFYNSNIGANHDAPFVLSARLNSPMEVILTMANTEDTYTLDNGIESYFLFGDASVSVLSSSIVNQEIILNLSSAISSGEVLSLLDTYGAGILSPYLRNDEGIGAVSFKEMSICGSLDITAQISDETCPGLNDGQLIISATGMTGPITYTWSNGLMGDNISNLAPGDYEVLASDSLGCAVRKSFTIANANVSAPINLNLVSASGTTMILNWNWLTANNMYYLQYRELGTSTWTNNTFTGTTAILNNLIACTDYEVRIGGDCSADGISAFNPIEVFTTTDCFVCTAPQNLYQFNIQNISAIITWDVLVGASSYTYSFREVGETAWATQSTAFPIAVLFGISACTDYEWTIGTTCYDGSTAQSGNINTFSTLCKGAVDSEEPTQQHNADEIIVFPNPVNSVLNLLLMENQSKAPVEIRNSNGKHMMEVAEPEIHMSIDISDWPNGLYYIQRSTFSESFIKN